MYLFWNDPAVRLTGRWSRTNAGLAVATTTGAYLEIAFRGEMALMHFDMNYAETPVPHLWIQVDDGAMTEAPVDRHMRIQASGRGNHVVRVIFKSAVEAYHRWYAPLSGRVAFQGVDVEARGELAEDPRPIIEFVGDSITEGILIDVDYSGTPAYSPEVLNRVYQDDVCAAYAWLTAETLNLRPIIMGYGAVGLTRSGSGNVPRVGVAYPQVFDGCPYAGEHPNIVVINHGANDSASTPDRYIARYGELVDLIREIHPEAKIVCLSAFCGNFAADLDAFVQRYNETHDTPIYFINSTGWVPREPLHPLRAGHRAIAAHLSEALRAIL